MAVHVATISLEKINSAGTRMDPTVSISERISNYTLEHRVVPDLDIPNTAEWPTIKEYLEDEDTDGFTLRHLDQTFIITYD